MSELTHVTAAIFRHVDFVAVMDRLSRGKRHASLRPQPSKHDLLASCLFDGRYEVLVVPRVHRRTLDRLPARKYSSELRPHVAAKSFRFDCGEHHRHIKHSGSFRKSDGIVNDCLSVEVRCSKEHLWLMVNKRHNTVIRRKKSLLAKLGTISV